MNRFPCVNYRYNSAGRSEVVNQLQIMGRVFMIRFTWQTDLFFVLDSMAFHKILK